MMVEKAAVGRGRRRERREKERDRMVRGHPFGTPAQPHNAKLCSFPYKFGVQVHLILCKISITGLTREHPFVNTPLLGRTGGHKVGYCVERPLT